MITFTGLDNASFIALLEEFSPVYDMFTPYSEDGSIRRIETSRGRPRSLRAVDCLALSLAWSRTRGSTSVLCMLFGITQSVCSMFLRFGRRILLRVLSNHDDAVIRLPTEQEIEGFKHAISSKYSTLTDVALVADGLKLYLQQSGDSVIQNMFFNGWTHDHYVGNVFVFAPSGVIVMCALNAPGAMHDSQIAEWGGTILLQIALSIDASFRF